MLTIEHIAEVTHETNRAYCRVLGDDSQPPWSEAPEWQKESARVGVTKILAGEITRPEQSHESWLEQKVADGWVCGEKKDPEAKTHPCMVPYHQLPETQRIKDTLFFNTVTALRPLF